MINKINLLKITLLNNYYAKRCCFMNNFNEIKNILKEIKKEIEPAFQTIRQARSVVAPVVNKIQNQLRDIIERYNLR